jgi:phage gpG-like protein
MIDAEIIGGQRVVDGLAQRVPRVTSGVERAIAALTIRLQRNVVTTKLQGQALNVKTGRLQRSITQRFEGAGSASPSGIVGTNVKYARAHEYGFHGTVTVREHLRAQTMAWGKSIAPQQVTVGAHSMKMNIPERSFLRSALREMAPEIFQTIDKAVREAVK